MFVLDYIKDNGNKEHNSVDNITWEQLKYDEEYIDLVGVYHKCNKSYYDFTIPFKDKIGQGKHLTKSEILTLTGIIPTIKNKDLQNKLYQTIIEELVLIVTGDD